MSLELTGKLIQILPELKGTSEKGDWVKQEFIVETQEQYPKKIAMTAWKDQVKRLNEFSPDSILKISFRLESREFNGKWYTNITPWKIEGQNNQSSAASNGNAVPQSSYATASVATDPMSSAPADSDDLPF